jgi:hypothetical protein
MKKIIMAVAVVMLVAGGTGAGYVAGHTIGHKAGVAQAHKEVKKETTKEVKKEIAIAVGTRTKKVLYERWQDAEANYDKKFTAFNKTHTGGQGVYEAQQDADDAKQIYKDAVDPFGHDDDDD